MPSYYLQTKKQLEKTQGLPVDILYLLVLAALGGATIGGVVGSIRLLASQTQQQLFGVSFILPYLPDLMTVNPWRLLLVPTIGGLILGLILVQLTKLNRLIIVDPVEANALKGGKMSALESLTLVGLSALSIVIGGSVGFEAAMTQLGAGFLSVIGQFLNLKRRDLRILVSCGAGAGLAAIFGAPLAGTFYALELVIGGYALRALMPTLIACAMSSLIVYILLGFKPIFQANIVELPSLWHLPLAAMIGVIAALVGITVMRCTTSFEAGLIKFKLPLWLRPALGGLVLGLIALAEPLVMGPGHSGINLVLAGNDPLSQSAWLLFAKIAATVICVGSGFRGGLFSASLLLGATLGYLLHQLIILPIFGQSIALDLTIIASMAGVSASIIGTPMAIILLMVEAANIHSGVISSTVAVVVASYLTKRWFGYSFSTWRFHLRGNELAAGPRDIARLRELTFFNIALTTLPNIGHAKEITKVNQQCLLDDYLTLAMNSKNHDIAVIDCFGKCLGYTSKDVILQRYLHELLCADYDECT